MKLNADTFVYGINIYFGNELKNRTQIDNLNWYKNLIKLGRGAAKKKPLQ